MTNIQISTLQEDALLFLKRFPNGGWTVSQRAIEATGRDPRELGAYGSAAEMLAALSAALCPEPPEDVP